MAAPIDEKAYRRVWGSWALYDVANSAFYLVIVAAIFPFFYLNLFVEANAPPGGTPAGEVLTALRTRGGSQLAFTAGLAMAIVAILGPILGATADRIAAKKKFLAAFASAGALACVLMFFIGPGDVLLASVLYAVGTIGVAGSIVFYDALLPSVARPGELDRISALGFAAGYLGSTVLLGLNVLWVLKPGWFGLAGPAVGARLSFLSVGFWWLLFTIPLLRFVPEPAVAAAAGEPGPVLLAGFRQLGRTLRSALRYRELLLFLGAYWIYSDGIGTIIKLATPFGYSLGLHEGHLIFALILTQLIGVPCALLFGRLARVIGARSGILIGLAVYTAICVGASVMSKTWHFYALAIAVGLVQGGTQALSRSLFASMIPQGQSAEFFGFFSAMEKFAGILGPLLVGIFWSTGGDPKKGIVAIAVFFVIGGVLLSRVNVEQGRRAAEGEFPASPASAEVRA